LVPRLTLTASVFAAANKSAHAEVVDRFPACPSTTPLHSWYAFIPPTPPVIGSGVSLLSKIDCSCASPRNCASGTNMHMEPTMPPRSNPNRNATKTALHRTGAAEALSCEAVGSTKVLGVPNGEYLRAKE